jgi:hypothetical protein
MVNVPIVVESVEGGERYVATVPTTAPATIAGRTRSAVEAHARDLCAEVLGDPDVVVVEQSVGG